MARFYSLKGKDTDHPVYSLITTAIQNMHSSFNGREYSSILTRNTRVATINHLIQHLNGHLIPSPLFTKTISSIAWHPSFRDKLLLGSKGGDLVFLTVPNQLDHYTDKCRIRNNTIKTIEVVEQYRWLGRGRGCSVTGIKFDPLNTDFFYYCSISGKICKFDLNTLRYLTLLEDSDFIDPIFFLDDDSIDLVNAFGRRFSCLDVNAERKVLIVGDNKGQINILPFNDHNPHKKDNHITAQLHNGCILNCEMNQFNQNIFTTSSVDWTAKVWDVRMIGKRRLAPIAKLDHVNAVNSSSFSALNGASLLTTDNLKTLRVYRGPNWELERVIKHQHRQYQQTSLFKASWYPYEDIVLIGRSSLTGIEEVPVIDVFDTCTGELMAIKHYSAQKLGVFPINSFNHAGDMIASALGSYLVIWKRDSI